MSVHRDKSGIYIKYKNKTIRKNDKGEHFSGKREAQAFEALLKTRAKEQLQKGIKLSELIYKFGIYKKQKLSIESWEKEQRYLTKYVLPVIGDKYISDISINDFNNLVTFLSESNFGTNHRNVIITKVKELFRYGTKFEGIENRNYEILSPFKKTYEDIQRAIDKQYKIWSINQFNKFYVYVNSEILKAEEERNIALSYRLHNILTFYVICFDTGARKGEIQGLRIKDYDFTNHMYSLNKQLKQKRNYSLDVMKNDSSIRDIHSGDFAHEYLIKHVQYLRTFNGYTDDWFLVGGVASIPNTTLDRYKDKLIDECNVPRITNHEFRHSHATLLLDMGVSLYAVSKRLGHSSIAITEKVYAHILNKKNKELIDKWNEATKSSQTLLK